MPLVACARMYGISKCWHQLFRWLSRESGVKLEIWDYPWPSPLPELWKRADLGVVFMCGYPFAKADPKPQLVAAPVPAASDYGDRPRYRTLFAVAATSGASGLPDCFGGTLAFTASHSHSGYNAVRYHLLRYTGQAKSKLFARTMGPLETPMRVVESILTGEADVGPLDSYFYDLLRMERPDLAARLRVIDRSDWGPIPPLVASPQVPAEAVQQLCTQLTRCSSYEPEFMKRLCLNRFAVVDSADYQILLERERAATLM